MESFDGVTKYTSVVPKVEVALQQLHGPEQIKQLCIGVTA